jgi:uncharacterized membrane protein
MTETHKRTIVRAISWRIVATLVTAAFTGINGAIIINIWMTIAHYIHERAWLKLDWGKIDGTKEKDTA